MPCWTSSSGSVLRYLFHHRLRDPLAALLLLLTLNVSSAELRDVYVEKIEKRYNLISYTYIDASAEDLFRVLIDYDLFTKFTSAFAESRNVAPDEQGRPRFYTRMEGCVIWWCKSLVRNGYLLLKPSSEIIAIVNPDTSNFNYSRERWRLRKEGDGTLLIYEFDMEPGFWVPPVIGPFLIKRTLRSGATDAVERIEALAQGKEPSPVSGG